MRYWGKLLGAILAILLGGNFWTIILSLLIGHIVDESQSPYMSGLGYFFSQENRQSIFFRTTFQVMGHLTKSKGRVTESDITNANSLMKRMKLSNALKNAAKEAFREGKKNDFPLRNRLREFRQICFGRSDLIGIFLEIQVQAAFADSYLHPNERKVLYIIAEELGISFHQLNQLISMMESSGHFNNHNRFYSDDDNVSGQKMQGPTIEDACKVLGVSLNEDICTIKRAYRKLMREHHPDKLIAKGLPPEMIEIAKQKTQEIQKAYNFLKQQRGFH